jgi:hypothetical protein
MTKPISNAATIAITTNKLIMLNPLGLISLNDFKSGEILSKSLNLTLN